MTEYYKFHEDVPRIYMEPMSSTVHMYYDYKRRLTYIRVTKMLAKQRKKVKEGQDQQNRDTKIKKPKGQRVSDEHDKTHKEKHCSKSSKDMVIVEEAQDILDFDCDADLENFGIKRKKKIFLNKSLKRVLPESLIYSLMDWKKKDDEKRQSDMTRTRIRTEPKYVDTNNDSQFFLRDFFANDWESHSEIWAADDRNKAGNLQTLPFEYPQKPEDSKSDTLLDLNAILESKNIGLDLIESKPVESFMIIKQPEESMKELKQVKNFKMMRKNTKEKLKVKWQEISESPKKNFNMDQSFYKQLKSKDIQKFLKRNKKEENGKPVLVSDQMRGMNILKQLKGCSQKFLQDKNLFRKKFNLSVKRKKLKEMPENEDKINIIKRIKVHDSQLTKKLSKNSSGEFCRSAKGINRSPL